MRPERWWSFILAMALFVALSPLSAQAGPNRPFAPQQNRQAFTPSQPNGNAYGLNGQNRQWQQPNGNTYGWNGQNRQWQQTNGNAYGWNGQNRQWVDHRNDYWRDDQRHRWWDEHRDAYGRDDHRHRWWDEHRDAYGWNDHQPQWQQPRPSFVQGNVLGNRQFQPPNGGQQYNPGSSYNRAGYPAQAQSPNTATGSSGYYHNTTIPASQTGAQSGSQSQGTSPSGTI